MKVYDLTTDSMLFNGMAYHVRFSKDGQYLITDYDAINKNYGFTIYNIQNWSILNSISTGIESMSFDISPDGKFVAQGKPWSNYVPTHDTIAYLNIYSLPDLKFIKTLITKSFLTINCIKFSDNNQYLAGALGSDGTNIWNTSDWSLFRYFSGDAYSCAFSPDNQYIIESDWTFHDATTNIWNINTEEEYHEEK